MQCGCPQCGVLMAQVQKGLRSYCCCPICFFACNRCLGLGQAPRPPMKKREAPPLQDPMDGDLEDEKDE